MWAATPNVGCDTQCGPRPTINIQCRVDGPDVHISNTIAPRRSIWALSWLTNMTVAPDDWL